MFGMLLAIRRNPYSAVVPVLPFSNCRIPLNRRLVVRSQSVDQVLVSDMKMEHL